MRVYISVDMEGVAGVVHEDQTNPVDPRHGAEYARFRRLMTAEANAAVRGAWAAGATAVVVNDSHWLMRNLLAEELDERAELISGDPKPWSMMEGIDEGFDAAFFIGYHAMAGTAPAVLDHTYTDMVAQARLDGRPVGELGLNAMLAGSHGTPVVLVTGDQAACAEGREWLGPAVGVVPVKTAIGRGAARSLAPNEACRRIEAAAAAALGRIGEPLTPPSPATIEVEFRMTSQAELAVLAPGSTRTGPRTVAWTGSAFPEVFRAWRALYNLAAAARA